MASKTLEETNSTSLRMLITSMVHQTNQHDRTSRGPFPPSRPASRFTNAASLRGFTDGSGALPPLLLHESETQPNLTPLGKCQNTSSSSHSQTSQHSSSTGAFSSNLLSLFAKTEEVAHKLLGPSLVADRAGIFIQVAERGTS